MAASKAVFSKLPGMPGRFRPVVAVNAKTGEEIGRGEIQIMLLLLVSAAVNKQKRRRPDGGF